MFQEKKPVLSRAVKRARRLFVGMRDENADQSWFATYPRQERKSTLPVVSIAVGMRSKNKNTAMLKYCGVKATSAYLGRVLEIIGSAFGGAL